MCAGMLGCGAPVAEEATVPVAAVVEDPEPRPTVPQDMYNLGQLENARKFGTPMHRDLANGRFLGGKFEDLVAAYPPDLILQHGPYMTALYASGMPRNALGRDYAVARNGKLVRAHGTGCVWHPIFFDALTEAELKAWAEGFDAAFRAHYGLPPRAPAPPPPAPNDDTIPPPREADAKSNP